MKIFDWNIHLYEKTPANVDLGIKQDTELSSEDLLNNLKRFLPDFQHAGIASANFMLFNHQVIHDENIESFLSYARSTLPGSVFCLLFDFRKRDYETELVLLKSLGFHSIKFHAYVQDIKKEDYQAIVKIAVRAEQLGLAINIDTSYGSTKMYRNNPLELAAEIVSKVKQTPVILLHSGGAKVLDAFLLADMCSNIYLETSLSLIYYSNFQLISSFKDVYRHLGPERILFASDYPFQLVGDAIDHQLELFESIGFSAEERELIFYENAKRLSLYGI
ncbi:MAG: amidohydrolase family protein [Bacteroidia bacterium]